MFYYAKEVDHVIKVLVIVIGQLFVNWLTVIGQLFVNWFSQYYRPRNKTMHADRLVDLYIGWNWNK